MQPTDNYKNIQVYCIEESCPELIYQLPQDSLGARKECAQSKLLGQGQCGNRIDVIGTLIGRPTVEYVFKYEISGQFV